MHWFKFTTLPGQREDGAADTWHATYTRGTWRLIACGFASKTFPTLEALMFCLDGVVAWERWTADTQRVLIHLGVAPRHATVTTPTDDGGAAALAAMLELP